jgi:hypothetical protein
MFQRRLSILFERNTGAYGIFKFGNFANARSFADMQGSLWSLFWVMIGFFG